MNVLAFRAIVMCGEGGYGALLRGAQVMLSRRALLIWSCSLHPSFSVGVDWGISPVGPLGRGEALFSQVPLSTFSCSFLKECLVGLVPAGCVVIMCRNCFLFWGNRSCIPFHATLTNFLWRFPGGKVGAGVVQGEVGFETYVRMTSRRRCLTILFVQ